jgi:hypothetical protein
LKRSLIFTPLLWAIDPTYKQHHDIKLYLDNLVFTLGFDLEFQISPAMVSNKSFGHPVRSSSTPSSPPQPTLGVASILL